MGNRITAAIAAIALALGLWNTLDGTRSTPFSNAPSRADSVVQKKVLRVAYFVVPPLLSKKPGSNDLSGPLYDFINDLGKNLSVKVEWVEEANLSTLGAGFDSGRYDLIAFPLWETGDRGKQVDFSIPLFYSRVSAYVRANDTRFDSDLTKINNPNITVAAIDGEMAGVIALADYPKAQIDSKPQLVDYSQLLLEVSSGKSDITFFNEIFGNRFIRANPGKIKRVPTNWPIRMFSETLVLPEGDYRFKELINSTLTEMLQNGALEAAMTRHGVDPNEYLLPAYPYRDSAPKR